MPGDDEQRVVDADAEPDQGGKDRAPSSGMLIACESRAIATVPLVSAVMAVTSGRAMPSRDPKAMRMMIAAAMRPKISLFAGGVLVHLGDRIAAELDLAARAPGRLAPGS